MKVIIQCSEAERDEAGDMLDWIRDGEFESTIDISIEVK